MSPPSPSEDARLSTAEPHPSGARADHDALRHVVAAHISEKNNSLEHTSRALEGALGSLERVIFAAQGEGFSWLDVS